jgi:hypothetical protein
MNRYPMKARYIYTLFFSLGSAISLMPCSDLRAELVQAHIEGIINSSPIPVLNGEAWALTLVFDTAAPEAPFTAGNPSLAEYFNTGPVKVLRMLDFSVGDSVDFTIHLVDPVPTNEFDVRIDIDNFDSKSFFTHVDDPALLPSGMGCDSTTSCSGSRISSRVATLTAPTTCRARIQPSRSLNSPALRRFASRSDRRAN